MSKIDFINESWDLKAIVDLSETFIKEDKVDQGIELIRLVKLFDKNYIYEKILCDAYYKKADEYNIVVNLCRLNNNLDKKVEVNQLEIISNIFCKAGLYFKDKGNKYEYISLFCLSISVDLSETTRLKENNTYIHTIKSHKKELFDKISDEFENIKPVIAEKSILNRLINEIGRAHV